MLVGQVWGWIFLGVCFLQKTSNASNDGTNLETQHEEERAVKSSMKMLPMKAIKKMKEKEDIVTGVGEVLFNLGGIATVANIDFNQPPEVVVRELGDTLIPLITLGLSLIPGVGPLIAGLVGGIWSLVSPFLGDEEKSPMEKMIEDIDNKFIALNKKIYEVANKTLLAARQERHEDLKKLVKLILVGEDARNRYICNKYAVVSKDYIDDIKNNRSIDEIRRAEIVSQIHDCDNFLKDTAAAFVFPKYADTLWIPCVMFTMFRLTFLAEIVNYGISLKIDAAMISMFWGEIKADIRRTLEFVVYGIEERVELVLPLLKAGNSLSHGGMDKYGFSRYSNFTEYEYEACSFQGQLLYFDREIYPYGVPKTYVVPDGETEVNVGDFNSKEAKGRNHVHIFYVTSSFENIDDYICLLYCLTGRAKILPFAEEQLSFRVRYAPNKAHQVRILYFTTKNSKNLKKYENWTSSDRTVMAAINKNKNLDITIKDGRPNVSNTPRFAIKTGFHTMLCFEPDDPDIGAYDFVPAGEAVKGSLIIETVATVYISDGDNQVGNIIIQQKEKTTVLMGLEIIVVPVDSADMQ